MAMHVGGCGRYRVPHRRISCQEVARVCAKLRLARRLRTANLAGAEALRTQLHHADTVRSGDGPLRRVAVVLASDLAVGVAAQPHVRRSPYLHGPEVARLRSRLIYDSCWRWCVSPHRGGGRGAPAQDRLPKGWRLPGGFASWKAIVLAEGPNWPVLAVAILHQRFAGFALCCPNGGRDFCSFDEG